jgi:hypothetical protein
MFGKRKKTPINIIELTEDELFKKIKKYPKLKEQILPLEKTDHHWNIRRILIYAARDGHRDICLLVKKWGVKKFNPMLRMAAFGGHQDLCDLAIEWGANDYEGMLEMAAFGGHEKLCNIAHETEKISPDCWMIYYAACGRHKKLCELSKKWNLFDANLMLYGAAYGGSKKFCRLARKWGATDFVEMKTQAAHGYQYTLRTFRLANKWLDEKNNHKK